MPCFKPVLLKKVQAKKIKIYSIMKTLIIITAIYLLLIVIVIALCKVRTMADKKAKEIFKDKTNDSKINQHRANN